MPDTLTLMRLGITGQLAKTLCSTNPCESMIEIVRYTQRNVKRWQDGDMRKRWTAAGMLVAEQQFRRIIGYRDLAKLVIAVERHALLAAAEATTSATRSPSPLPSDRQPTGIAVEVPRRSGDRNRNRANGFAGRSNHSATSPKAASVASVSQHRTVATRSQWMARQRLDADRLAAAYERDGAGC